MPPSPTSTRRSSGSSRRRCRVGRTPRSRPTTSAFVDHCIVFAEREGIARDRFELQMLYGVRPTLQLELVRRGHTVRVATPYGPEWYPYLMRRLAERPANLAFFARNLVRR